MSDKPGTGSASPQIDGPALRMGITESIGSSLGHFRLIRFPAMGRLPGNPKSSL